MSETLALALAGLAGALLGAFFFGGLWWTIRRGILSPWPVYWFLGSLLVRMGVVTAGFYGVAGGHWNRLVACLAGFVLARWVITWRLRPLREAGNRPTREASHAS